MTDPLSALEPWFFVGYRRGDEFREAYDRARAIIAGESPPDAAVFGALVSFVQYTQRDRSAVLAALAALRVALTQGGGQPPKCLGDVQRGGGLRQVRSGEDSQITNER